MTSRYVIIGAGAVGATVAAQLYEAGTDVVLVARGAHLEALRASGLRYVRPDSDRKIPVPVAGGPEDIDLRAGDVLVLATKSQDSEALLAAWAWRPVAPAGTAAEALPVVLLQNGLENARTALRRFHTVVDAVVIIPSSYSTPGEVVSPSAPLVGAFYLGLAPRGTSPVVDRIAADLRLAAFAVQVVPDVDRWKAGKLLGNLGYNLDAVYRPGPARDALAEALVAEARQVLAEAGVEVTEVIGNRGALDLSGLVHHEIAGHDRQGSSTWQSLARGASVESDFLNGEIALLARLHGTSAPLNAGVQRDIARAAQEAAGPGLLGEDAVHRLLASARPAVGVGSGSGSDVVLVDAATLHAELAAEQPPVLLDVRWALGDPHGQDHYLAGHLPGAVYVDLDTELASPPTPQAGRHPLPTVADLQGAARRWGLRNGRPVVVYDDNGGLSAARAWWLLRWAGLTDVRILDGALTAWREAGYALEPGAVTPAPGDVVLGSGHLPTLDADTAARVADDGVLLDARAPERFRGEVEPVDPRAGHIPGAVSASTGDNLDTRGRFRTPDELRERFAALGTATGDRPVGVYCGSGVTAAHEVAALAIAGISAALYPGSWSAWSSDPGRPVATGP
ncbi:rhodanese-like domain-containing protein [Parafrankia elaeagni]|uniref:rhodanese-like domain-containing protein n=1 Tax=Parafrankia elaeagni TaxID=222534 RepID=UPI000381106D|nr:rhodanese-like domain-containing protein [Parafrankia elaeagni]